MQTKRFTSGERIYAITILLLGLGIWIYCAWRYPVQTSDFSPLSLFLSFLILATLTIRFGLNVKPDLTLYVDTALLVSATLRYSPMVNLMIAGIASVASLKGRESLSSAKYYLDIGQRLTYVGISALFLNLFGLSPWIPVDFMSWVVMLVTLSLISFIRATINSGYLSLQSGESFFLTYKRQVISTFWPDTALFGVGIVIILLVADNPWRLLLIVIPSFIVFLTLNQLTRVQGKLEKEVRERERVEKILRDSISEEKHSQDIQKTIYQISQAANAAQNLDELFPAIHSILGGLLPAENFFIALIDPVSEILQFPYFVDQYDPPPSPRKMGRGLTEYLIRAGTPIFANPEVFDNLVKEGKVDNVGTPSVD